MTDTPDDLTTPDTDTGDAPDTETTQTETEDATGKNAEAARYRVKLREAEGERDALRGQLETIRRQVAEDASGLQRPAALWAAGVDVATLYTPEGTLDRQKLTEAVTTASEALGLARKAGTPKPDRSIGLGGGTRGRGFADAFRPNR